MKIQDIDPLFNEESFKSKVNNIFVILYSSVMNKDIKRVDHFISDEIYNEYNSLIENLKQNNYVQMYEQLNVKSTEIQSIKIDNEKIIINVELISRAIEYIMDFNGNKISGNDKNRIERKYELVLEKRIDVRKQAIARKCPGCGANMDVNYSGECKYCGTIYNNEDYDWILTNIKMVG